MKHDLGDGAGQRMERGRGMEQGRGLAACRPSFPGLGSSLGTRPAPGAAVCSPFSPCNPAFSLQRYQPLAEGPHSFPDLD